MYSLGQSDYDARHDFFCHGDPIYSSPPMGLSHVPSHCGSLGLGPSGTGLAHIQCAAQSLPRYGCEAGPSPCARDSPGMTAAKPLPGRRASQPMEQVYGPWQEEQMTRDHVELAAQQRLRGTDGWSVQGRLGHRAFHMPADPAHPECQSNLLLHGPEPKCRPDDGRTTAQPAERGHFRHPERAHWPWLEHVEEKVVVNPMRRDEQPGLERGRECLVPGGYGQLTSRMSTSHANLRTTSLPLSSEQQQRRLEYNSVVNGRHGSGHLTPPMSTGVTFPRPSSREGPVPMNGRRERLNVSVLELAGFEGPQHDPVSQPDNLRPQHRQEEPQRQIPGTSAPHQRGYAEAAQPPLLRGWDARASAQPHGEGHNVPLENPSLQQAREGMTYLPPPDPRWTVPMPNRLQPVRASPAWPEYPVANAVVADRHRMWTGCPYEEAVEARAWPGPATTHAYADKELRQPRRALRSPVLQPRVPSPPTVYRELPMDSAGRVRHRHSSFVHANGSCIEGSPAECDYCMQHYQAALTPHSGMQKPELYDGSSMEWGDYLELFESVADWNGWTERDKAAQLRMSLRGPALKVLRTLPPQAKGNYKRLCEAMQSAFDPPERVLVHKATFKARTRHSKETPIEFANVLHTLASKAYPMKKLAELDEILLDQFVEGLDDTRVQEHILLSHPRTLSEAVRTAMEIESIRNARAKWAGKPQVAAVQVKEGSPGKSAAAADMDQLEAKLQKLIQLMESLGTSTAPTPVQPKGRKGIKCFYCKQKGHVRRECRQQKRDAMHRQMTGPTLATLTAAPPEHLNRMGPGPHTPDRPRS